MATLSLFLRDRLTGQVALERSEGDFEKQELVPVHGLRGTGAPCWGLWGI